MYQIIDIGRNDKYYPSRRSLIGLIGEFTIAIDGRNGWYRGTFLTKFPPNILQGFTLNFTEVKLEELDVPDN